MFKKLKYNQEVIADIKEDSKNLLLVLLITLAIGVPLTYLMYHPLFIY